MKAKYGKHVEIYAPGLVGSMMISSEADNVSAKEMAKDFKIELLGDYFARAMQHRHTPGNTGGS